MKNSIKRAQSQACLGFAERKNFRPLAKLKKLSLTLLMLITAAAGAWAQGPWDSGSCTVTLNNGTLTVSGKGAMANYDNSYERSWNDNRNDITSVVVESGVTTAGQAAFYHFENLTSVTLPEGLTRIGVDAFRYCNNLTSITIPSTVTSIGADAFFCLSSSSKMTDVYLYPDPANLTWVDGDCNDFKGDKATQCHVLAEHLSAYQTKFSGKVNVTVVGDLEPLPTPIEVTTNAASEQDLFTTASFKMPASDVTVNYTLVRDMQDATNPVAFSGLPTTTTAPIIVKKGDNGKYQPAEALTIQLIDPLAAAEAQNIIAADGITIKVLVGNGGTPIEYDQVNPITLEAFLADMKPGYYWIKAEATDENSPYDGTVYSSEFTVVEQYDLTVQAADDDFSAGKLDKVSVVSGEETKDVTLDENGKTTIDPNVTVKLTTKPNYIMTAVNATNITTTIAPTKNTETKQYEATFTMPQKDVTVTYTIRRDITEKVTATMSSNSIRIKKDGDTYQPVDATQLAVTVTDNLDTENPVNMTEGTDYTLTLQKQGDTEDDWTDVTAYSVGTFRYMITGTGNYSGVIYTDPFKLFEGYEVEVPAGEYITYYAAENLKVEDTDAQLYTITSVNETAATATLSNVLTVAPANTPLLVKNNSNTEKKFLLIPTTVTADEVTAATEFKGSTTATTIAASTTAKNNYAFNGKEFVWVKDALNIPANKAWLSISGSGPSNTRSISIVFDSETTGIGGVSSTVETGDGNWYDLNGRKFTTKPTKKGVYIVNGKKVVIKN